MENEINQKPAGLIEAEQKRALRVASYKKELCVLLKGIDEVTFEIGCGTGHFLNEYSINYPNEFCIGVDLITKRIGASNRKKINEDTSLKGELHFFKAEAKEFLDALCSLVKIKKMFILFPDPWPKRKAHKNRIFQDEFLNYLYPKFAEEGKLYFRTDYKEYFVSSKKIASLNKNWTIQENENLPIEVNTQFQKLFDSFDTLVLLKKTSEN